MEDITRFIAATVPTSRNERFDDGVPERTAPETFTGADGKECSPCRALVRGDHYRELDAMGFRASNRGRRATKPPIDS